MVNRSRPVLLLVEPEEETRQLMERLLRDRYEENEIVTASSKNEANDTLVSFKLRGAQVALMLVACDLQGDSGAEFLEKACELFPHSKRVMLAGYDQKDSVLKTLTRLSLDNYLLKPLQSEADDVYPLVDDLLKDWQASSPASAEGVRIVGMRWSPRSHQIKKFLASNLVPYHWLEIEESVEARRLIEAAGADARRLPVVFFPDGTHMVQPEITVVAEKVGLRQQADSRFYDLIVVGGGPAGLSAAVYGASEGLSTLLIEAEAPGGQAGQSSRIENYLGFPSGLSGNELTRRAVAQAQRFGVEIITPREATGIHLLGDYRQVEMADGSRVSCHAALIATGVSYMRMKVPGEERLAGAGVYYGAVITEAISCTGKEVFILGGGNSAGQAAMYLARFARHITMLTIEDAFENMSQYLIDQIEETENVTPRFSSTISEMHGREHLEAITIEDQRTGKTETIETEAMFIYIGAKPRTDWLGDTLARDEQGYILTGADVVSARKLDHYRHLGRDPLFLESSVPGIFAAGDTRTGSVKRIASGVGEGAMAVALIHQYLSTL